MTVELQSLSVSLSVKIVVQFYRPVCFHTSLTDLIIMCRAILDPATDSEPGVRGREREREREVSEGDLAANWVTWRCCNSPGVLTRTLECIWEM